MKKAITFMAVMFSLAAVSQAQVSFGVHAGVNFQNINGKDYNGDKLTNDLKTGFQGGVVVELPVAPDFYIQPGLSFSTKGAKEKQGEFTGKLSISYLELPIHFLYKPKLGSGKLIVGFGPYVAYGVGGKMKFEGGGTSETRNLKFKNKLTTEQLMDDNIYVRPLDAGADIFFGYEFNFKVSVQLNAQLGLLKMDPSYEGNENDKSVSKNTGFGLSLGYRF